MKTYYYALMLAASLALAACTSNDDDWGTITTVTPSSSGSIDISTEDIEFDTSFLDEGTETVPATDNDYVENSTFTHTVYVNFNGQTATVTDADGAVTQAISGAHVTLTSTMKEVEYVLSGSSDDGSLKLYSDYKHKITLDGLTLTNPTGAAINDQCGKSMYVVIATGTENTLTDGSTYSDSGDEDMKATLFSEGQIIFSGAGTLNINANCKNGIASDDYIVFRPGNVINVVSSVSNGVKANDYVIVRGGVLNIGVTTAGTKGINSEGQVNIEGGRTTILTYGGTVVEDSDTKSCAGIKSDSTFTMTAGELNIQSSGAGGKGINCDTDISISGGTVNIVTTGTQYVSGRYDSSPKGIKGDSSVVVSGGEVNVTCTGGDGAEGIESKSTITISGGDVVVNSYDDAINASSKITISGGRVYACATNNDGIDSNGTLYITGGTVIAFGTSTPEGPFDCDNSTFSITGGTVIGMGGESSVPTTSATKQPVILLGGKSYSSGAYVSVHDSSGSGLFSFKVPRSYTSCVLVVSSSQMAVGGSYTIKSGVSVSGGTTWQGFSDDATISGGSTLQTVSLSSYITTSGSTSSSTGLGGMGPGGFGGRW